MYFICKILCVYFIHVKNYIRRKSQIISIQFNSSLLTQIKKLTCYQTLTVISTHIYEKRLFWFQKDS